jgi:hypothetical protein
MKYFKFILIIIMVNFLNVFSQKLPDFTIHNRPDEIYFGEVFFNERESQKVGHDYLFVSVVSPRNNTLVTDTIFFSFNEALYRIRIKKISFSRNGADYYSVDSFPVRDTIKWRFVDEQGDSILFNDSLLSIRFSSFGRSSKVLKLQMDKEYSINKDDTFKILLDTLPLKAPTETVPLLGRPRKLMQSNYNKPFYLICELRHFSFGDKTSNGFFNLAGKKQYKIKTSNIYISKLK